MAQKRSLNVGIVGLSTLGTLIARNIAFKSRTAVYLQLYNPSNTAKMRRLCDELWEDGAQCAMRLHTEKSTLLKWSEILILATPESMTHELMGVFLPQTGSLQPPSHYPGSASPSDRNDSILNNLRPGHIVVDHSAFTHQYVLHTAAEVRRRGAFYLDAPFSGNAAQVKMGALTLMIGGEVAAYEKILPLFRLYADSITHMGDSGTGAAAKQIVQQLVGIHTVAAAEAMTLAHHFEIQDYTKLISVLDASWGSSVMLRRNGATLEKLLRNPGDPPPSAPFNVSVLHRELKHLLPGENPLDEQEEACHPSTSPSPLPQLPLTSLCFNLYKKALQCGSGSAEPASVVHFLDAEANESRTGKKKMRFRRLRKARRQWRGKGHKRSNSLTCFEKDRGETSAQETGKSDKLNESKTVAAFPTKHEVEEGGGGGQSEEGQKRTSFPSVYKSGKKSSREVHFKRDLIPSTLKPRLTRKSIESY